MSDKGITRVGTMRWDETDKKWVKDTGSASSDPTGLQNVQISGVTPVNGKLPVDTELIVEGNIIVQDVSIRSAPLTEVTPSGTYAKLMTASDLITVIQYNEPSTRTTVSGITYSSATLGTTAYETFVSGTNTITISRL